MATPPPSAAMNTASASAKENEREKARASTLLHLGQPENGISSSALLRALAEPKPPETVVDVLEITVGEEGEGEAGWSPGLDHEGLIGMCGKEEAVPPGGPLLRILFLNITPLRGRDRLVSVHPKTQEYFRTRFGVSLLFLDCLGPIPWGAKNGNARFDRRNDAGEILQTKALYHFHTEDRPCDVWVSRERATQQTTYIISCCSTKARARILLCADSPDCLSLTRPCVVDTFLADAASDGLKTSLQDARERLLHYERHGASRIPTELIQETFQNLHHLSQTWHILHEDIIDHEECLAFVLSLQDHVGQHPTTQINNFSNSNHEAIGFLQSRNELWKRWVGNYNARTQIRINLYFNLASQGDNKINIEIANTSKKIAEATLRDSSSMITIATMTMLFLPGTFVSAILSMSFFNNGTDSSGNPTLEVLPQWWIFPATTIPLTLLVFALWRLWQQKRLKEKVHSDAKKRETFLNVKRHALNVTSLFTGNNAEATISNDQAMENDIIETKISPGIRGLFKRKSGAHSSATEKAGDVP